MKFTLIHPYQCIILLHLASQPLYTACIYVYYAGAASLGAEKSAQKVVVPKRLFPFFYPKKTACGALIPPLPTYFLGPPAARGGGAKKVQNTLFVSWPYSATFSYSPHTLFSAPTHHHYTTQHALLTYGLEFRRCWTHAPAMEKKKGHSTPKLIPLPFINPWQNT